MKNTIVVYDFETSSTDPWTTQPLQLAAVAIHGGTLEFKSNSHFNSMIRPSSFAELSDDNISFHCKVRNITKEEFKDILTKAPPLEAVINNFVQYLGTFNYRKNKFTAPICAGFNNRRFDDIIWKRMSQQFDIKDDENFHCSDNLDVLDIAKLWLGELAEPTKYSLDSLREFFGLDKTGAHDALTDVNQTGAILIRFLKLHKKLAPTIKFKYSMKN